MARGVGKNRMRLVKARRLSAPAQHLTEAFGLHLAPERSGAAKLTGFVLISLYDAGTTNKTIYKPDRGDGAPIGADMFQALCHVAIDNIFVDRIADDRACDRVNAALGYDPENDPAA